MKALFVLSLALLSANASAALREPGHYTGHCHGVSVMGEYENGKQVQRQSSTFRYEIDLVVIAEGNARIESTKSTMFSDWGPNGDVFTHKMKVEEVLPGLIRKTNLELGGACDYQVDEGGMEVWIGCTGKDGKWKPATGQTYSFVGSENVEYSTQIDREGAGPKPGEDFSGWALSYSNLWCMNRPAK